MKFTSRILATFLLLLMVTLLTSCIEEMDSGSASTASTPPPDQPPDQPPRSQTVVPGQSALGGAKRAAENTRDRVADYQRKIEKDIEDN